METCSSTKRQVDLLPHPSLSHTQARSHLPLLPGRCRRRRFVVNFVVVVVAADFVACEHARRRFRKYNTYKSRYTKNDSGVSAQDMVAQDPHSDVARLLEENERGDLW